VLLVSYVSSVLLIRSARLRRGMQISSFFYWLIRSITRSWRRPSRGSLVTRWLRHVSKSFSNIPSRLSNWHQATSSAKADTVPSY
jgi:hypothetical protein